MMRLLLTLFVTVGCLGAEDLAAGRKQFLSRCATCHGGDGTGGEMGPPIGARLAARDDNRLTELIHVGIPARGMPANAVEGEALTNLIAFSRTLQKYAEAGPERRTVSLTSGATLEGRVMGEGFDDLQLQTADKHVHLLRRAATGYREVTSQKDWPTYNGETGGNRFTELTQINKDNVAKLTARWTFTMPNAGRLQMTPVVVDGIMYVTAPDQCFALDAGTGRQIWKYEVKQGTRRGRRDSGPNRGVGVAGDRVFMETYAAHLVALNRFTGELLWDSVIADPGKSYFATSAPLPAGDLVISGVGGGEHGANGFVAAFDQATGKEAWRFSSVPKRGEPGSETWKGQELDHGGAPTWFTGSYDAELDTVYWPTGNPSEEYNGDNRPGDNLYSDCILALDRKTGKLKWHYQFTPHDLWDWDSTETSVMINADWKGQQRKLMLHADRNGFFYVFDRGTGELLLAKQFLRNVTWASGIGADGRPVKLPNQEPTDAGTKVCPSQDGATNWFSPSYSPLTGLYYFQTFEKCSYYSKSENETWEPGKTYLGGSQRTSPDPKPVRELKALDIRTGKVVWTLPQPGPAQSWGGTIATASGLVFFGEEGGALVAADATSGKPLWSFATNETWKASPMAYSFDGKQYLAVASGASVLAFALPAAEFPSATISNGSVEAKLYLPDPDNGYYRATRFDWSGQMPSLTYKGHSYFGEWNPAPYDPKLHDAIMGPVEEFLTDGTGLGYADAKAGGTFIKIGVGVIRKPEERKFQQFKTYEVVDPGQWRVVKNKDQVEFTQAVRDPSSGYAYEYTKVVRLVEGKPEMVLEHRLKNTGAKEIVSDVYEHNFYMLDNQPTGPDVVVKFPFPVKATQDLKGLAETRGNTLVYLKELQAGQSAQSDLTGFGSSANNYDISVENVKTGAGVRQTSDRPISRINYWSIRSTPCPEAYIHMAVAPGKTFTWNITYDFYERARQ